MNLSDTVHQYLSIQMDMFSNIMDLLLCILLGICYNTILHPSPYLDSYYNTILYLFLVLVNNLEFRLHHDHTLVLRRRLHRPETLLGNLDYKRNILPHEILVYNEGTTKVHFFHIQIHDFHLHNLVFLPFTVNIQKNLYQDFEYPAPRPYEPGLAQDTPASL